MNVRDAQAEQGKQYDHRLLLVPGNVVNDRQVIDTLQPKGLLQGHCDHHQRVTVVALSGIEYARNAPDIPKRQLVVTVLGAAGR